MGYRMISKTVVYMWEVFGKKRAKCGSRTGKRWLLKGIKAEVKDS